jgi:hypothetical protein
MDRAEAEALRARLEDVVRAGWGERDPEVRVSSTLHPDNKIDLTVVSALFAGRAGLEREAFFWPVFAPVPRPDLIHMTYCLLLTPEEARRHFATPGPPPGQDNRDAWADDAD